jgi:hypothetical protein
VGGRISNGHELILAAMNIYITNVIIFGLLYWEMDGGGPGQRLAPQMAAPKLAPKDWMPTTNATAFSPTDTMPLTRRMKLLMAIQATASLITIALVAARAVNILN